MSEREHDLMLSETTGDTDRTPPTGRSAMLMAALALGVLLLALQLWLLTLALDLYLSGQRQNTWQLVLISGLVFIGGLALLRLLPNRRNA